MLHDMVNAVIIPLIDEASMWYQSNYMGVSRSHANAQRRLHSGKLHVWKPEIWTIKFRLLLIDRLKMSIEGITLELEPKCVFFPFFFVCCRSERVPAVGVRQSFRRGKWVNWTSYARRLSSWRTRLEWEPFSLVYKCVH